MTEKVTVDCPRRRLSQAPVLWEQMLWTSYCKTVTSDPQSVPGLCMGLPPSLVPHRGRLLLEGKLGSGVLAEGSRGSSLCRDRVALRGVLGLVPSSLEDASSVTAMQNKQITGGAMPGLENKAPISSLKAN